MSKYHLRVFTGGAVGVDYLADKYFGEFALVTHISFKGHKANLDKGVVQIKSQQALDRAIPFYTFACDMLCRAEAKDQYIRNLCLRNFYQVAPANIVYAFGSFDSETHMMEGGTGYAIEYGKMMGKAMCVTDIEDETIWFTENGIEWNQIYDYTYLVNYKYETIAVIGTRKPNKYCEEQIKYIAHAYGLF